MKNNIKQKLIDLVDELSRRHGTEVQIRLKGLREKQEKITRIKQFFNGILIPMVIKEVGKDGKYETDKKRYTLYETYGPLEVDITKVEKKYKKMKLEEYVDKKEARKDAIKAAKEGKELPGLIVNKVERVRKS